MSDYQFALVIKSQPLTEEQILHAADALADAGCTDASLRGHSEGMELLFDRSSKSLRAAITSAIADVERAGFKVVRVEMERAAIAI